MDSSPVLRQQSQNKIRHDIMRTKNGHNKVPAHPKPSKLLSAPHLSNKNIENQDPGISGIGRKAPVRPGVSRLPVLAKSLRLQTLSDFSQTHCRWEEKPLAGKTRKKKPCTRPVPFNLSQPKPAFSAEACLDNMSLLSLKDPAKSSHASQNTQLTTEGSSSKSSSDKAENFQSDHAALLSILWNEGVRATDGGSATPQSNYNYLPQRVSVMKSRQKAGPGLIKSLQFSPDRAALQSILQNEGVKAGGPVGATPRNSTCPPGRGTSIYTAQRVPLRKNRAEATGGAVAISVKETPLNKWTPQRVRNTRHQPMSAMKWPLSTQQSPYAGTPGLRSYKANLQPHQEEIVQRLFDDQEDESIPNVTDKDPETRAERLPVQVTTTASHCGEQVEVSGVGSNEVEEDQQEIVGGQPFLQAPQRESVIFFSTGKTLLRARRFEKQEGAARHQQHGPVLPLHEELSSVSVPTCEINPPVKRLHRDLIVQKTCAPSLAVAMLRKRFPPLEELRLDEEVASYTSGSVQAAPGFFPPRPRCGNPLPSILHSEEAFTFVPIGFDPSSGCFSPPSSLLQGR
ncbi:hypothetical protein VZT92_026059 [Zoarces viviparus]|uniref:Tastin n=1 Tax=Zoarces viviparus TaxID=48416 RepID=A0AAW1E1A4_ZOAVI